MTEILAQGVVSVFAIFLITLGVAAFVKPGLFGGFLSGFAQSAQVHFLEMAVRLLLGTSFLFCARTVYYGMAFQVLGWMLLLTTGVLVLIPWKIHQQFARRVVPPALKYTPLIGSTSIGVGILLVLGLASGGEI